jgi:hypothetical protein
MAKVRPSYDLVTRELIADFVKTLQIQDAQTGLEWDQYPIVTLAIGHVTALLKHGQEKSARDCARQYFDRLQQIEKVLNSPHITRAKERIFRFVTVGDFADRGPLPARTQPRIGKARSRKG